VVVIVLGVLEAAEPEPMSVLVPVEPVVPEAPMAVPLPGVLPALVLVSVLAVPGVVVLALLELSVEGAGAGTVVLLVVDDVELSVRFSPQPARARAAIRARAAALAIGLVCIRELLGFVSFRFVWRSVWNRQRRMRCLGTFWWANARSMSSATVEACRTSCALPLTDACFFLQARA
jgi:hypothetical protein